MRFVLILLLWGLSSCWMLRAYKVRKMQLTDHQKLPSVAVQKPATSFQFPDATGNPAYRSLAEYLDTNLLHSRTAAFLVIRHDSLIYERYFNGFGASSLLPSNSMAKSFTGTLAGIALEEGAIRSDGEAVTAYLPELRQSDPRFDQVTIRHLLDMRSGIDSREGAYNLRDDAVRISFRPDVKKHLLRLRTAGPPGRFRYQSVNTQLLGLIIERTTGKKLSCYLQEKLWDVVGAEAAATWNTDPHKHIISSAGLNATARDFAKLGRLYLRGGSWNGKQVVPLQWIKTIASADTMQQYGGYKNQWWSRMAARSFRDSSEAEAFRTGITYAAHVQRAGAQYRVAYRTGAFHADGFMNQILYINPKKDLLIIRLGQKWQHPENFIRFIYNLGEQL